MSVSKSSLAGRFDASKLSNYEVLEIFKFLTPYELLQAGLTCKLWHELSRCGFLWKHQLIQRFKLLPKTSLPPGKLSWYEEYRRLFYCVPRICTQEIKLHRGKIRHVTFTPCGRYFVTCSEDGFATLWDLKGAAKITIERKLDHYHYREYISYCQVNADLKLLLVGVVTLYFGRGSRIQLYDLKTDEMLFSHNYPFNMGAYLFDEYVLIYGNMLISTSMSMCRFLIIPQKANKMSSPVELVGPGRDCQPSSLHNHHSCRVHDMMVLDEPAGTPSDKVLQDDDVVHDWVCDCSQEKPKKKPAELSAHPDMSSASPSKLLLFFTSTKFWWPHVIGLKRVKQLRPSSRVVEVPQDKSLKTGFTCIGVDKYLDLKSSIIGKAVSPDNRYLFVSCCSWKKEKEEGKNCLPVDVVVHIVDLATFTRVHLLKRPKIPMRLSWDPAIQNLGLSVNNEYLASSTTEKHAYLWDRHYGCCLRRYTHEDRVSCVSVSPSDSSILVTVSHDSSIKIWRSKQYIDNNQ